MELRRTASPILDRYNNTIERVEKKLRTLLNEKDRISRDSAKRMEEDRENSYRLGRALREAENTIRLLEKDNRDLQHTLMVNNRRWEEEYEAVSRDLETLRVKYHTLVASRAKTYDYTCDSPRRTSINKDSGKDRQKSFFQNPQLLDSQK